MTDDPYVYPGTDVLRNELGIRDRDELRRVESDLTYWRALRLATAPIPGSYDLAHLQACHRALFGGLYTWAGQLRTVRIAKADVFCLPQFIESSACEIFARLSRERHLVGLARDEFIDRLATYWATSTRSIRFAKATAAPSASSSGSSPTRPATACAGSSWTLNEMSRHQSRPRAATCGRYTSCSTRSWRHSPEIAPRRGLTGEVGTSSRAVLRRGGQRPTELGLR